MGATEMEGVRQTRETSLHTHNHIHACLTGVGRSSFIATSTLQWSDHDLQNKQIKKDRKRKNSPSGNKIQVKKRKIAKPSLRSTILYRSFATGSIFSAKPLFVENWRREQKCVIIYHLKQKKICCEKWVHLPFHVRWRKITGD